MIVLGVLLVSFVAFQLWGTALYTDHAQSHLKSELSSELHRKLPVAPAAMTSQSHTGQPSLAAHPAPTRAGPPINSPIGLLSIPKIGLLDAIVEGVGEAQLAQGPGHYPGTSIPGQAGNAAIAGHRTTYAHPFYNLNELAPGDPIYVLTSQGFFRYVVARTEIVAPTDVAVLNTVGNQSTLTLTTCNPRYSAATRMVVVADFKGPAPKVAPTTVPTSTTVPRHRVRLGTLAGDALSGSSNSWWPAIGWGALAIGAVVAVVLLRRARPRVLRVAVGVAGAAVFIVALFVCYQEISLALPSGF
jgi:sortase A